MLYDNSELLRVFAHALAAEPDAVTAKEYRRVIEGIADWTRSVMSDPAGGYAASQDADVGLHDDGDYFTWTVDEAKAVTSDAEFGALARHFDIEPAGEMHHNPARNV